MIRRQADVSECVAGVGVTVPIERMANEFWAIRSRRDLERQLAGGWAALGFSEKSRERRGFSSGSGRSARKGGSRPLGSKKPAGRKASRPRKR